MVTVHAPKLVLIVSLALALAACSHEVADPRIGPALVEAITLSDSPEPTRTFTGVVSARVQSDLGFRVPGKVTARLIDSGQEVSKGQALMRIDRTDYDLALTAAENVVASARARALQAVADEKRYRELVPAGAVSVSRYDQSKADADAAQAQLSAALAQADVARNEAGYSILVADADGVVVDTLAEPGHVVAAGQTVVRLAHAGPREATISLPEAIRPAIGSRATATLYVGTGETGSARLRQLSNAADPRTRTFDARYVLEGAAANAPLGSTVSIAVSDHSENAAARQIPLSAIYDNGKGPGVWRIDSSGENLAVHWIPVTVVGIGDETATVTKGIAPADRLVALGAHMLHEGQTVILATTKLVPNQ